MYSAAQSTSKQIKKKETNKVKQVWQRPNKSITKLVCQSHLESISLLYKQQPASIMGLLGSGAPCGAMLTGNEILLFSQLSVSCSSSLQSVSSVPVTVTALRAVW